MRIQKMNAPKGTTPAQIVITNWVSGQGKMPQQASRAKATWEVTVNGTTTTVYHNTSKTGINYYYINIKNQWMWSRDEFTAGKYETVKAKVTAPATTPAQA